MNPVRSLAARLAGRLHVVFINYGEFGNNSGKHIEAFARGLAARGHEVAVLADGRPSEADLPEGLAVRKEEGGRSERLRRLLSRRSVVLHAWTPRESVRRLTLELAGPARPYLVHLEDDEEVVTSAICDVAWNRLQALTGAEAEARIPEPLSRPHLYRRFLGGAAAVTVITPALRDLVPPGVPTEILEPGVEGFGRLQPSARGTVRQRLGLGSGTTALIHHGGVHPANQRDIFSLYAAVGRLRADGRDIVLLRPGRAAQVNRRSTAFDRADGVLTLGYLPRMELLAVLGAADICVQPGGLTPFNLRRLPSKLPEFLMSGHPTVTGAANLGARLRHGEEALLLRTGSVEELAGRLRDLLSAPRLAAHVGETGRAFALRHLRWGDRIDGLESIYRRALVQRAPAVASG